MGEVQRVWEYSRGTWDEVPSPLTGDGDWNSAATAAGYEYFEMVGGEDSMIAIHHGHGDKYICRVGLGSNSFLTVLCRDTPSLFMFLRDYAPLVHSQVQSDFLEELKLKGKSA